MTTTMTHGVGSRRLRRRCLLRCGLLPNFNSRNLGLLSHTVTSYKGDDARRAFDYHVDLLKDCRTWTEPDKNGDPVTYTVSPLSFPKLGDQTFAFRMTMAPIPLVGSVTADAVYVRRGNIVSSVLAMALGPSGTSGIQLEALVRKAVDRIR